VVRQEREDRMSIEIFKDRSKGGNGSFVIRTDAESVESFLGEAGWALRETLEATKGDEEFTMEHCLPLICSLYAKLKGYKDDTVYESRQLLVGAPFVPDQDKVGSWPHLSGNRKR